MSFQTHVTWSESDQAAGMSLPAPYFYDESIFQKERLHIFLKSWHLVAGWTAILVLSIKEGRNCRTPLRLTLFYYERHSERHHVGTNRENRAVH